MRLVFAVVGGLLIVSTVAALGLPGDSGKGQADRPKSARASDVVGPVTVEQAGSFERPIASGTAPRVDMAEPAEDERVILQEDLAREGDLYRLIDVDLSSVSG
jgi:hypothetical protein